MPHANAIVIREPGDPDVLELGTVDLPEPGPTQVLVQVAAAGLNRADCLQRRGFYPAPPGVPAEVPGLEFAGTIAEVGSKVSGWSPGDRVMGIVGGGGMAELVVTESRELMRVPEALSLQEAAAVPEVFLTVFDGVVVQGGLGEGDTVLYHAVASGIGTAGIQIARAVGATSIGTSRTADKLARCEALGLDHAVLVNDGQFAEGVLEAAPKGVDVILDTIGAAYLGQNVKVLAKRGRVVVIGLMGGVKGELPLGALLAKRGSVTGSVLRSRSTDEKAKLTEAFARQMLPHFDTGTLKPVVDEIIPMAAIRQAHERMDANQTFGKLVLTW